MRLNPEPEVKKGLCFLGLGLGWLVYLFFSPISAIITALFVGAALLIHYKKFAA